MMGTRTPALALATLIAMGSAAFGDSGPGPGVLRVATYNVSMYRDRAGRLLEELETGESDQARKIAEVLQRVRPHVVLLCEFDYEPGPGRLPKAFREKYLERPQAGLEPIEFTAFCYRPVNTGVDSGKDLDRDGRLHGPADAWGYGAYPGQYGMLLLSRLPIGASRTYRRLEWGRALDPPTWPKDPKTGEHYYTEGERRAMPLASKSFWDVDIRLPSGLRAEGAKTLHLLCLHPTPPVFDGPEDRNGCRNYDEIRWVAEYISNRGERAYPEDANEGHAGLPAEGPFIVLGDLNADPVDGGSRPGAIQQLLDHPAVDASFVPTSRGAVEASRRRADLNADHRGDPSHDTADFSGDGHSNLRVDYVLPSKGLKVVGGGVFWPMPGDPGADAIRASDHRLVWTDIQIDER